MVINHYLNDILIDEPIGYDGFKTSIKRAETHGISAEVSMSDLEFYNEAASIIKNAYDQDIDTEITYRVVQVCDDQDIEIYSGVVDLSTYSNQKSEYCSVKVKVGEIGVRTTFNNRLDTEVDIKSLETIDGDTLNEYKNLSRYIEFPAKAIRYTTSAKNKYIDDDGYEYFPSLTVVANDDVRSGVIDIATGFNTQDVAEIDYLGNDQFFHMTSQFNSDSAFFINNSSLTGSAPKVTIKSNFNITVNNSTVSTIKGYYLIALKKKNITTPVVIFESATVSLSKSGSEFSHTFDIDKSFTSPVELSQVEWISCFIGLSSFGTNGGGVEFRNTTINIVQSAGNYFKVTSDTTAVNTNSNVSLVHEAFSRIGEIICGKSVKSDWLSRIDSDVNGNSSPCGGGALKCIILGYWLRNAVDSSENEYKLNLSFKSLFESINAIDNIGYGFVNENNDLALRVEQSDWFYKTNVVFEINNPSSIERVIDTASHTKLAVGYSNYSDIEEINAIDTFHTLRSFITGIKAVDNELNAKCEFVADPYAIETTRRKAIDKTTEDWKYDEKVFIAALKASPSTTQVPLTHYQNGDLKVTDDALMNKLIVGDVLTIDSVEHTITNIYQNGFITVTGSLFPGNWSGVATLGRSLSLSLSVDQGATDSDDTIFSQETVLNARISPERNAARWVKNLFKFNSAKSAISMSSSTGNVSAKCKTISQSNTYYLDDPFSDQLVSESQNIDKIEPLQRSELLNVSYNLSIIEFNQIKNDPYGIIQLNGEDTWLKELEYDYSSGEAKFKLIPRND